MVEAQKRRCPVCDDSIRVLDAEDEALAISGCSLCHGTGVIHRTKLGNKAGPISSGILCDCVEHGYAMLANGATPSNGGSPLAGDKFDTDHVRISTSDLTAIILERDRLREQVKNLQEESTRQLLQIRELKAARNKRINDDWANRNKKGCLDGQ